MTIALIDGDELLYKVAYACQKITYYACNIETEDTAPFGSRGEAYQFIGNEENYDVVLCERPTVAEHIATTRADKYMENVMKDVGATDQRTYITGPGNFRINLATIQPYKGNRSSLRPRYYELLKQHLIDYWDAVVTEGIEADDALAIANTELQLEGTDCVICCQDKDLDTVPSRRYNPTTGELYVIDYRQGWYNFYHQMLTGDSTDHIPGIRGVGPVTATRLLEGVKDEKDAYRRALARYGKAKQYKGMNTEVVVLEMGRLLHMLRSRDDVWNPPL